MCICKYMSKCVCLWIFVLMYICIYVCVYIYMNIYFDVDMLVVSM